MQHFHKYVSLRFIRCAGKNIFSNWMLKKLKVLTLILLAFCKFRIILSVDKIIHFLNIIHCPNFHWKPNFGGRALHCCFRPLKVSFVRNTEIHTRSISVLLALTCSALPRDALWSHASTSKVLSPSVRYMFCMSASLQPEILLSNVRSFTTSKSSRCSSMIETHWLVFLGK